MTRPAGRSESSASPACMHVAGRSRLRTPGAQGQTRRRPRCGHLGHPRKSAGRSVHAAPDHRRIPARNTARRNAVLTLVPTKATVRQRRQSSWRLGRTCRWQAAHDRGAPRWTDPRHGRPDRRAAGPDPVPTGHDLRQTAARLAVTAGARDSNSADARPRIRRADAAIPTPTVPGHLDAVAAHLDEVVGKRSVGFMWVNPTAEHVQHHLQGL